MLRAIYLSGGHCEPESSSGLNTRSVCFYPYSICFVLVCLLILVFKSMARMKLCLSIYICMVVAVLFTAYVSSGESSHLLHPSFLLNQSWPYQSFCLWLVARLVHAGASSFSCQQALVMVGALLCPVLR